jgi:hypothetical protein
MPRLPDPPDPSERFVLTDSHGSAADPVEGNPFPVDDPFHPVWRRATQTAEEEVCHIRSRALSGLASHDASEWPDAYVVATFDAWAKRSASVVWSDRAVQHYDQWLIVYANLWIDAVTLPFLATTPTPAIARMLVEVRDRLGARVEAWKAAARRTRAEQTANSSPPGVPPEAGQTPFVDAFLRENRFPASHPAQPQWVDTSRQLAADLARAESAVWSARATPADATTLVESLATWTAAYFDALSHAHLIVVTDNGEGGLEAYQRVLDALRVQALKAGEALHARAAAQAQALTAAFPGATTSNATCLALVADVHQRLMPAVTLRVSQRQAERWLEACTTAFSQKRGAGPRHVHVTRVPSPHGPTPRGWDDIEIRFLSDLKFQAVVNGIVQEPQNYADVGFGDGRRGNDAPKVAWETLRKLAEGRGVMSAAATATDWRKVEKHIQEIRRRLRVHFALAGDPVPYIDGAYRTRFTIGVSASYEQ